MGIWGKASTTQSFDLIVLHRQMVSYCVDERLHISVITVQFALPITYSLHDCIVKCLC